MDIFGLIIRVFRVISLVFPSEMRKRSLPSNAIVVTSLCSVFANATPKMTKYPLFFFLFFIISKNVNALQCYVTDLPALRSQLDSAQPIVKNCKTYFDDFGVGGLVGNEFLCVTVTAESSQAHVSIQGCLTPQDTCEDLKSQVKLMESVSGFHYDNLTCNKCNTDYCNSGVSHSIVLKNRPNSGISRQTVFWISVLVGVGIMVICVAIALFIKKKKSGAVYKV